MNKVIAIIFFCLLQFFGISQTITENNIDEFTKNKVVRTTWEPICKSKNIYAHVRGSKINDIYTLDIKIMNGGSVFAIKNGPNIMFKSISDSVIVLDVPKYEISCRGCGAINIIGSDGQGVALYIPIEKEVVEYLIKNPVKKMRIYTTDGYVESDLKEKFQETLSNIFRLIK